MKSRFTKKTIPSVGGFILLLYLLNFLACGASDPEFQAPRLVILYETCTVNKEYLSPYNKDIIFTPNLKKFATGSTAFTNHQTEAGQSGTAFASIFSGTQAEDHGVYRHPTILANDSYLISEAFAENSYETFFWSSHGMASAALNYGQGVKDKNTFAKLLLADDPRFLKILEELNSNKDYKAFVMTNFNVTHSPYRIQNLRQFSRWYPSEAQGINTEETNKYYKLYRKHYLQLQWNFPETIKRLDLSENEVLRLAQIIELVYKSRINYLDSLFGRILSKLSLYGLLDESLVVFTADHGETLYREDQLFKWTHGHTLTPDVLNVPLIIRSPNPEIKPGTYEKVTRSIDVFPTVVGLSGISIPPGENVKGVDLSPVLRGREPAPEIPSYSHGTISAVPLNQEKPWTLRRKYFPKEEGIEKIWVSIREKNIAFKLRNFGNNTWGVEAFDLESDPDATKDVFNANDPKHKEMAKKLKNYKELLVKKYRERTHSNKKKLKQSISHEDEIKALKSLGYIK